MLIDVDPADRPRPAADQGWSLFGRHRTPHVSTRRSRVCGARWPARR